MENYALNVLKKEQLLLKEIIENWKIEGYEEAKKDRLKKYNQIEKAILLIEKNISYGY